MSRPSPFLVTASNDEEPPLGEGGNSRQQSELQPGEIRRPGVHPPTPLMDWGRGDSIMWDANFGGVDHETFDDLSHPNVMAAAVTALGVGPNNTGNGAVIHSPTGRVPELPGRHLSTPLSGYGRGDNIWGVSPTGQQGETRQFPTASDNDRARDSHHHHSQQQQYGGYPREESNNNHNTRPHQPQQHYGGGHDSRQQQQQQQQGNNYSRQRQDQQQGGRQPYYDQNQGSAGGQQHYGSDRAARGGAAGMGGQSYGNNPYASHPAQASFLEMAREHSSGPLQMRSQSQILSDELYLQAQRFPPPPPPRVPKESRRSRSELWYYYASKWDITHTQPPPPRCPLSLMEEEYAESLPAFTKVPYRGEYWLDRCIHWFNHIQNNFHSPEPHSPNLISAAFALNRCVTE